MSTSTPLDSIVLPVMPMKDMVVFPNAITPLFVMRPRSLVTLEESMGKDKHVFLVSQKNSEAENPEPADLYSIGVVAEILQVLRVPDGSAKILVEGKYAARCLDFIPNDRYLQGLVVRMHVDPGDAKKIESMKRRCLRIFENYAKNSDRIPEDLFNSIRNIDDAASLSNAIANYVPLRPQDKQSLLENTNLEEKLYALANFLEHETELLEIENEIIGQVKSNIGKSQREYYLQEQLKVIERELGVGEEDEEIGALMLRVKESRLSKEAQEKAERELTRLSKMAPLSPEAAVARSYVEWLVDIPWYKTTSDRIDLDRALRILDEDHYGLKKIKDRIVEFLAVAKRVKELRGPILCFVGPPGVGKTSLARSIARCVNRKFVRVSLGGVRDEAEIRGHRRTYVGALPGKVVQQMKRAGTVNPVFLLDEIDKMSSDFRGDPASALLEVLDPEQNHSFNDHYLEVDYNLSRVLFIATANTTEGIPLPLQDRMEIIRLPGYTEDEKRKIASRFIIPKQMTAHGLTAADLAINEEAIDRVINQYTREAGVRNLEREFSGLCRKVVKGMGLKKHNRESQVPGVEFPERGPVTIGGKEVRSLLGPPRFLDQELDRQPEVGLALGLAWTEAGGELLPVETIITKGRGNLLLTGKLGDVLQESAKAALTFIRAHADSYNIKNSFYKDSDIHVHIPEGATPKDGPSAGITLTLSLVSALSGIPARQDLAMTGEITLRGKVLKIGGLKEKVLAAHRHQLRTVVIPADNMAEVEEIGEDVRKAMTFIAVRRLEEVLDLALVRPGSRGAKDKPKTPGRSGRRSTTTTRPAATTSHRANP